MAWHAACSAPKLLPSAEIRRAVTGPRNGGCRGGPWSGPAAGDDRCLRCSGRRYLAGPPLPESHLRVLSAPQAFLGGEERVLGAPHGFLSGGERCLAPRSGLG